MRISSRQPDGLSQFYDECYRRLVGVLTVASGSREDAEEVVQEAFIRLIPRWEAVARYDNPEAWLRTVALRLLSNRRRHARHAARFWARVKSSPAPLVDESGRLDLASAVASLPIGQRHVVVLYYLCDFTIEEVADQLHLPRGTVKSRLARARSALAQLLEEEVLNDA